MINQTVDIYRSREAPNRKASWMIPIIKAALISTGIAAMSLFLKASLPHVVDFSVSRLPILWSSFLSWLKPPYIFVAINVIIITILASSSYYRIIGDHGGEYKTDQIKPIVRHAPPRQLEMNDTDFDFVAIFPPPILLDTVDRSEDVYEEKEDISGLINGRDECVVLPPTVEESKNPSPVEKPLVSGSSGHRKWVKASLKGGNRRKALRVVRPKRQETMENTEEGKSTPLTSHYRSTDTFGVDDGEVQGALRKSETLRDVTNYYQSKVTPPVKIKKEMSPEEMDRKFEAFIKKGKKERVESMRLDKEMV